MKAKKIAGDKSIYGFKDTKRDAYPDVRRACNRFLRDRITRGLMKDTTGLMKYYTPSNP